MAPVAGKGPLLYCEYTFINVFMEIGLSFYQRGSRKSSQILQREPLEIRFSI